MNHFEDIGTVSSTANANALDHGLKSSNTVDVCTCVVVGRNRSITKHLDVSAKPHVFAHQECVRVCD